MSEVIFGGGVKDHLPDGTFLPSITYAMSVYYKVPFIGTTWNELNFPESRNWFHYLKGVSTPLTWFDYTENCRQLGSKNNFYYMSDFSDRHRTLLNGFNDLDAEELEIYKKEFNNDVSWLYGSLDEGGIYIIKSLRGQSISDLGYFINCIWGLVEREPENEDYYRGKYYYANTTVGGGRYSLESLKRVAWCIHVEQTHNPNEDEINNYPYYLSMFMAGSNWYHSFGCISNLGLTTPQDATDDPTWADWIGPNPIDQPVEAWYWEGGTDNRLLDIYGFTIEHAKLLNGDPLSDDEFGDSPTNNSGGNSGGGGYGIPSSETGNEDFTNLTDLNRLTAINSGLATLYNPTQAELQSFANWLYTGITDSISLQLKKLIANPIDYILFVTLAKFTPPVYGSKEIGFAGVGSGVSAQNITDQFTQVDCGSITYNEQFGSFLDYHGSVKVYLPFCGIHDLSPMDVMGSTIHIKYTIDQLSGSCVAQIKITRSMRSTAPRDSRTNDILYEFTGNVYETMPISASDWRGAYQSLVTLAGGVIGGATLGGFKGIAAATVATANALTTQKLNVSRSGQAGSSYGYLGKDKPFLILERPIQSVPTNFGAFEGYMSNNYAKISSLSGYTEFDPDTVWSDFGKATEEECEMIKNILNGGVYL